MSLEEEGHKKILEGYGGNQLYEEFVQNMNDKELDLIVIPVIGVTFEVARQWPMNL